MQLIRWRHVVLVLCFVSSFFALKGQNAFFFTRDPRYQDTPPTLVYNNHNASAPSCRTWRQSTWSSQASLCNINGRGNWVMMSHSPVKHEILACLLDNQSDINVLRYFGFKFHFINYYYGYWMWRPTELTSNAGTYTQPVCAVAHEQVSGDALVVYRSGSSAALRYRIWNGSFWAGENTVSTSLSGSPTRIKLVSKPAGDAILLVYMDSNSDLYAVQWDGTRFGRGVVLEDSAVSRDKECFDAAYDSDGNAMVVWGRAGSNTPWYRQWDGEAWGRAAPVADIGGTSEVFQLASSHLDRGMFLMSMNKGSELHLTEWDGSAWGRPLLVDNRATVGDKRCFDVAFEPDGVNALAVWGQQGGRNLCYRSFDGNKWSSLSTGPNVGQTPVYIQLSPTRSGSTILGACQLRGKGAGYVFHWNGSAVADAKAFSTQLEGNGKYVPFQLTEYVRGGLIGHWTFNETGGTTAGDISGNNHPGKLKNMSGLEDWVDGRLDNGLAFDGKNDSVDMGKVFYNGERMTVSVWVNPDSLGANRQIVSHGRNNNYINWGLKVSSDDGKVNFEMSQYYRTIRSVTSTSTLRAGSWTHLAVTFDGTTCSLYWNGTLEGSAAAKPASTGRYIWNYLTYYSSIYNTYFTIGSVGYKPQPNQYWHGLIDDVRLYNRALSADEISAMVGAMTQDAMIAHWQLDDEYGIDATDASGYAHHGTLTGGPTWAEGLFEGGLSLDGHSEYVRLESGSSLFPDTSSLTLAGWFKTDETYRTSRASIGGHVLSIPGVAGIGAYGDGSDTVMAAYNNGGDRALTFEDASCQDDYWHHLACTYEESSGELILYYDGIAVASLDNVGELSPAGARRASVGSYDGASGFFNGLLDDVRIYNYALPAPEVAALTGLIGYWKLDETSGKTAADATGNGITGTLRLGDGNEWAGGQIGTGSLQLEGDGEFAQTENSDTTLQVAGDYSTAVWVKADRSQVSGAGIYGKAGSSRSNHFGLQIAGSSGSGLRSSPVSNSTSELRVCHGAGSQWSTRIGLDAIAGRWHHLAITYSADDEAVKSYLDGELVATGRLGTPASGLGHLNIGANASQTAFKGHLDDMRIYDRALTAGEVARLASMGDGAIQIMRWREMRN